MARRRHSRTFTCLAASSGLVAALVAGVVAGPASAGEGDPVTPTPAATAGATVDVPADASTDTMAALASAQERLVALQAAVAQTALDYKSAQARLSLAGQSVLAAERQAVRAEQAVARAGVQVGQYAANAYRGGPMAGTAAFLDFDDPSELLHAAGMLDVVGDNQAGALARLRHGREDAVAARDRARTGRDAAAAAQADANRLVAQAKEQTAETVALLETLQERAGKEAAAAAQARELAAARAAAASATGGIGDLPAAATGAGPTPGLPEVAGPDPGDGEPGPDHLRPRAERALLLVQDLFGITDIGGWRQSDSVSSDHPNGKAIDIMLTTVGALPDPTRVQLGWQVARWAQANATGLGVTYLIWQGRIWSVARSAEGWRDYTVNFPYGTNVTPTTLHMDHVHVSFG